MSSTSGRPIRSKGTRGRLAGLWGEILAEETVEQHGWIVSAEDSGGLHAGSDFWAQHEKTGKWLVAQVKASTKGMGGIVWRKPGAEGIQVLLRKAKRWDAHAIFVLMHLEPSAAFLSGGGVVVPRPKVIAISGCTALEWAAKVDERRAEYAALPFKRASRVGEVRDPNNSLYPCQVTDFTPLGEFMEQLPTT